MVIYHLAGFTPLPWTLSVGGAAGAHSTWRRGGGHGGRSHRYDGCVGRAVGGCAKVIVADIIQPKLDIIGAYNGIETVNIRNRPLAGAVAEATDEWGSISFSNALGRGVSDPGHA